MEKEPWIWGGYEAAITSSCGSLFPAGPHQDVTPVCQVRACDVRSEYTYTEGDNQRWIVPRSWVHSNTSWPLPGAHRDYVFVPDFDKMIARNETGGYQYCFCIFCSMRRARYGSLAGIQPAHGNWPCS